MLKRVCLIPMKHLLGIMPIHGYDYLYNAFLIMFFILHRVFSNFPFRAAAALPPKTKWPTR